MQNILNNVNTTCLCHLLPIKSLISSTSFLVPFLLSDIECQSELSNADTAREINSDVMDQTESKGKCCFVKFTTQHLTLVKNTCLAPILDSKRPYWAPIFWYSSTRKTASVSCGNVLSRPGKGRGGEEESFTLPDFSEIYLGRIRCRRLTFIEFYTYF